MTCVVGIVSGGRVYMGADTCASDGQTKASHPRRKIFKIQDDMLIGCSGSFRVMDIIEHRLKLPKHGKSSDQKYMHSIVPNAIRRCLVDWKFFETITEKDDVEWDMLIGYNGHLYTMQNDYSILPAPARGTAIGSGAEAANAILFHYGSKKVTPRYKLRSALEAAAATIVSVQKPFNFMDLKE